MTQTELMAAYKDACKVRDQWCAEYTKVRDALAGLVGRLDEIHADPAYRSVWTMSQIHGGPYNGPTYTAELASAREALAG